MHMLYKQLYIYRERERKRCHSRLMTRGVVIVVSHISMLRVT